MELHSINSTRLTLLEAGQFISRQLTDIQSLGNPVFLTNEDFKDYLQALDERQQAFAKALVPVRTSDNTIKLEEQDRLRDQAFIALKKAIEVYKFTYEAEKQDAYRSLSNLFKAYKNLDKLNYGAESLAIDELLNDLNSSKYQPMVEFFNLGGFVSDLQEHNNDFKTLFEGRTQEAALQEAFDAKALRKEMFAVYNEFCTYILAMARLKSSDPVFKEVLNLLNTNRKYYSDMLSRRKGVATETVSE